MELLEVQVVVVVEGMEGCLWDRGKARHRLPTRCGADSNSDDPSLFLGCY